MFPAARVGDPITHDQLVPCGIILPMMAPPPTVFIEGLPAATVGCQCSCTGTMSVPPFVAHPPFPPPHPASFPPIVKGSTTVFINGMPAARWSPAPDLAVCGVFLGDAKLAATRRVFIGG